MNPINKLIAIAMILLMISATLTQKQMAAGPQATGAATVGNADDFSAMSATASGCPGVSFNQSAGSPFGVGARPNFVAVGDFNLDGKPDMATASSMSNSVTILLGDGAGGFR